MNADLIADLHDAELANYNRAPCPVCVILAKIEDEATKSALERALTGTIGAKKLALILSKHGMRVSDRKIRNHQAEKRATS